MTVRRSSTVGSAQASLGERLAQYATGLSYEDLPEDVIRIAKRTILDTFGCAFGGYSAGPSKIAIKLASDASSKQGATVLIGGLTTSPDLAVFPNRRIAPYPTFHPPSLPPPHHPPHPHH